MEDVNDEIVDLLKEVLGKPKKYYENRGQISFNCPECDDGRNKGNFEVNINYGVYKCWSCGEENDTHGTLGKLFDKYGSDFDTMVAKTPSLLMQKAITDLKNAAEYCEFHLEPSDDGLDEVAPPGAKAERMVKHIKKGYAKDGKLTPKEKAIAYATTWKAHKEGKVEEESKPDFLDVDKDGNKKESFKKAVKDAEKVEEAYMGFEKVKKAAAAEV